MERPQIGCILMAAGASARFGSDKLAAELGGRSLLRRACEAVPAARFRRVCIVTARAEGEALAREFGFQLVRNDRPELGASLTVRLGLSALQDCDAALFMTADQPLLRRETVERLLDAWSRAGAHRRSRPQRRAREPGRLPSRLLPRADDPGRRPRRLRRDKAPPRVPAAGRRRGS